MVYPNDLDEKDNDLNDTAPKEHLKENLPEGMTSALKKKRGTLASTTSNNHHKHHHHHRHSQTAAGHSNPNNHLQLPAILIDNAFARDNSSICRHRIEEGPPESLWTKFCICCLRIDTKVINYMNSYISPHSVSRIYGFLHWHCFKWDWNPFLFFPKPIPLWIAFIGFSHHLFFGIICPIPPKS